MHKRISKTFLFTVVIAIVALSALTEAIARVCILHMGGTCVFWSGSVEGELIADKLGDIIKEPKSLGFTVTPKKGGLLFCKNSDIMEPVIRPLEDRFVGEIGEFGGSVKIKQKDDDKDASTVNVFARLNDTQLRKLDKHCNDSKLKAIDFVPIGFDVKVFLTKEESKENLATAQFNCEPLGWKTLKWKKDKPERRQFKCKLQK